MRWLFILTFSLISMKCYYCLQWDPLERIIQTALLTFRLISEKIVSKIEIPRMDTLLPATVRYNLRANGGIVNAMYSLLDFLDTCPICKKISSTTIVGQWRITYMSKSLLITVMNDLNKLISRLQANQSISFVKSFDMLFAPVADYRCASISFVTGESGSPVEISYIIGDSFRSIIATMNIVNDKYELHFTPTLSLNLCLVAEENTEWPHNSVLVFAQSDTFPSCINYIVLTRDVAYTNLTPSVRFISQNVKISPKNRLSRIECT